MDQIFLVILAFSLLGLALARGKNITAQQYLFNSHSTGAAYSIASAVAGNVGVGTVVGIYTFASHGPMMAASIVISYSAGLLLTGFLAQRIRKAAKRYGHGSMIDFVAGSHKLDNRTVVWLSIGVVFLLQLSVQLTALALIIAEVFAIDSVVAVLVAALLAGTYITIGGYRSATTTDLPQALLILLLAIVVYSFLDYKQISPTDFIKMGDYSLVMVIGAFLFLGPTVFISVDNWHRVTTALNDSTAMKAYITASLVCLFIYGSYVSLGVGIGSENVTGALGSVVPDWGYWIVPGVLAMAILSTMDTTIAPLVTSLSNKEASILRLRIHMASLFAVITIISLLFDNIVQGIVSAFSSFAIFLPVVLGGMLIKNPRKNALLLSLPFPVAFTAVLSFIIPDYAVIVGFILSAFLYWIGHYFFAPKDTG